MNRVLRGILILTFCIVAGGCGVDPEAQNNSGNDRLRRGNLDAALTAYQVAQVNLPDEPVPYFNAGIVYLETGEYAQAQVFLEQALLSADAETLPEVHFALGEAHFQQANFRQAIEAYRQVLLLRPDDDDARYNLQLAILSVPTETPTFTPTPTTTSTDETQNITSTPTQTLTPTSDSPDPSTITPTPPPQNNPDESNQESTPDAEDSNNQPPPMEEESALALLDDVQQGQGVLFSPESEIFSGNAASERDW